MKITLTYLKKESVLTTLIVVFTTFLINAQSFNNLNFEKALSSKDSIPFWSLNQKINQASLDLGFNNNGYSLKLSKSQNWRKNFFQDSEIEIEDLKKYEITVRIKTDGVVGNNSKAYIWANIYTKDSLLINYTNNKQKKISGSTDWQSYSLEFFVPRNAKRIRIGGGLEGNGTAWFDDFQIRPLSINKEKLHISKVSEEYLEKTVSIMRKKALHRQKLNFDDIHQIMRFSIDGAENIEDTHSSINRLSRVLLADGHSQLWSAKQVKSILGLDTLDIEKLKKDILQHIEPSKIDSLKQTIGFAESKLLDGNVGYISIPAFQGLYWEQLEIFADSLQSSIETLEKSNVKGWIVDLRKNWGGVNMAMIGGIGSLLDDENAFYYLDANDNIVNKSYYKEGLFYDIDEDNDTLVLNVKRKHQLKTKKVPIAILINQTTASAGEVVLASFLGQENIMTFGAQTNGAVTGNSAIFLDDGSLLHLSTSYLADRNKKVYREGIKPDVVVQEIDNKKEDAVLNSAKKWIENR